MRDSINVHAFELMVHFAGSEECFWYVDVLSYALQVGQYFRILFFHYRLFAKTY